MPEMFAPALPPEGSQTTATSITTEDMPPQSKSDKEMGPTTSILAPQALSSQATPTGMVYVSAISIRAMAQRLSHIESQLTQFVP